MLRTLGVAILASAAATGCGTTYYAFVPATNSTTAIYGHAAADYTIPPQAPHGDLRVASYGIEPMSSSDDPDQQMNALHLRMSVSNTGTQPWTVDTREQQLALDGRGTSTPAFATASPDTTNSSPPIVTVAPGSTRLVDLFFPLPPDMQQSSDLPAFQFSSKVHTDADVVAETTPFTRIETDSDSAYASDDSMPQSPEYNPYVYGYDYWDSPFWYNPVYVGFYGGVYFPPYFRGGHPVYGRGYGWGRPGYYHGAYRGGGAYHGAYHGGFHGGGGGGFHGGGGHGGGHR